MLGRSRNPFISPDTQYEKSYTALVIVGGTIAFALIIGDVNAMVRTYDDKGSAHRRKLANVRNFIRSHELPEGLGRKMLTYAEGHWQMTGGIDNSQLHKLPPLLRARVMMAVHTELRKECPLFIGQPYHCVALIVCSLEPMLCLQNEPLIEPGQPLWELFLLNRGSLMIKRAFEVTLTRQVRAHARRHHPPPLHVCPTRSPRPPWEAAPFVHHSSIA